MFNPLLVCVSQGVWRSIQHELSPYMSTVTVVKSLADPKVRRGWLGWVVEEVVSSSLYGSLVDKQTQHRLFFSKAQDLCCCLPQISNCLSRNWQQNCGVAMAEMAECG